MAVGAPTPGSTAFYALPIAQRQQLYNVAKFSAGGEEVPASLYFTDPEVRYIQQASMPTAAWADQIRTKYPTWAPYLNMPEIGDILKQAVDAGTQPAQLQSQIQATDWWRNHSDTQRQWFLLNATDPAAAAQSLQGQMQEVQRAAQQYGVHVSPSIMTGIAVNALASGWDQNRILDELVQLQANTGGQMTGVLGSTKDDLQKIASDYMVPMGNNALTKWTRQVATGDATSDGFTSYVRGIAKSQFSDPQIVKALDGGQTMTQIADPYIQEAAQALNIAPDEVNMQDPKWRRALQFRPNATEPGRAMTLDEWGQTLRTDPSYGYDYTDAAKASAAQLTGYLAQTFGRTG